MSFFSQAASAMATSSLIKAYGMPCSSDIRRDLVALVNRNLDFQIVHVNLQVGDRASILLSLNRQSPIRSFSVCPSRAFRHPVASSSAIKVYGRPRSSSVRRVLVALAEKNLDFEIVPVNPKMGDNKKPEYLALQPFGFIPVFQDEDTTLFESRAIIRYVAEKYKDQGSRLYGSTLEEKAVVEQWLEVEAQNYHPAIKPINTQLVAAPKKGMATDKGVVEESVSKLNKVLDVYEEHLGKNKYLAGNFFSLADLSHLPLTFAIMTNTDKGDLFTSRKNVRSWFERISSRPAWKQVVALA